MIFLACLLLPAARGEGKLNYQTRANELAVEFLREPRSEAEVKTFVTNIRGANFQAAVGAAITTARALIDDGVPADDPNFAALLADNTGAPVSAPAPAATRTAIPPPGTVTTNTAPAAKPTPDGQTPIDPLQKLTSTVQEFIDSQKKAEADKKALEAKADAEALQVPYATFIAGSRTQAPYKISDTGRIDSSSTNSHGFIEFVLNNTWAWQADKVAQTKKAFALGAPKETHEWFPFKESKRNNFLDYSVRLGYEFGTDKQPSASTITGSGDFSAETTVGLQLVRGWSEDDKSAYSVDLVGSWTGVTDRDALRIHNRWFIGPGVNFGFNPDSKGRRALFSVRAGLWTRLDQPRRGPVVTGPISSATGAAVGTFRPVLFEDGHPLYHQVTSKGLNIGAFEAELNYPLATNSYLTLGGRLYGHLDPDVWNVYVGVTFPLKNLTGAFEPEKSGTK